MDFIDIGSNLTHESFAPDREAVVERAMQAEVRRQIVTGADLPSSRHAAALSASSSTLWCTAGVHPHHAGNFAGSQRAELLELVMRDRVVAVGECGLDYYRNFSTPAAQRTAFVAQLSIAVEVNKPVFLHQREAHQDFEAILREFRGSLKAGVAHCFTAGAGELESYLDLNLHIGVTGWVCDERRGMALREVVPMIPAERLLLETDAPYLLPRDLRPKPKSRRNEPCFLPHIARVVAGLRSVTLESLAILTTRNAEALFSLTSS